MRIKGLSTAVIFAVAMLLARGGLVHAAASDHFDSEYGITYDILSDGVTKITQEIQITNKGADIIADSYTLTIKKMDVFDIEGENDRGPLEMEVDRDDDSEETKIKVQLVGSAIGDKKVSKFKVIYKSRDIANRVGEVWNINIPEIAGLDKIKAYDIYLKIPVGLGPKIYISPTPVEETRGDGYRAYRFDKEVLRGTGIAASFGKYQQLNFRLKYELKNTSIFPIRQSVAFPPEILGRQQINYSGITPAPKRVWGDVDGNTMASFLLWPQQKLTVSLTGSARVLGNQINPKLGGAFSDISAELVDTYTKPDKYWEVDSEEVQELATKILDEKLTVSENAGGVYDYIVKNLEYDFNIVSADFIERRGAVAVIADQGVWACMEFTDLFIAVSRAMGIPARELNGYAFTDDPNVNPVSIDLKGGDVLHAWPEFYDPAFGWVAVDPTWGTTSGLDFFTKLDTNHFVFVIKGADSEWPLPAGAYRFDDEDKQVDVALSREAGTGDALGEFKPRLSAKKMFRPDLSILLGKKVAYRVKNSGNVAVYGLKAKEDGGDSVKGGFGENLLPWEETVIYLPKGSNAVTLYDFIGNLHEVSL